MATIKSHTDISQSRKLAEILPLESADMCWKYQKDRWVSEQDYEEFPQFEYATDKRDILCWSLAALISVLPKSLIYTPNPALDGYSCKNIMHDLETYADNPVDACVDMIMRLHELKML